jgi:hypothetical protein
VIVRYEAFRGVHVVDDLRNEERAAGILLSEQTQVLFAVASVALGDRDATKQQVRLQLRS